MTDSERAEMNKLFENEPIADGLVDIWGELVILDLTLKEYWDLFWSNEAPAFLDTYHKEQNEHNVITKVTKWYSPPEARF